MPHKRTRVGVELLSGAAATEPTRRVTLEPFAIDSCRFEHLTHLSNVCIESELQSWEREPRCEHAPLLIRRRGTNLKVAAFPLLSQSIVPSSSCTSLVVSGGSTTNGQYEAVPWDSEIKQDT